ncbi:MAG: ATP-binding protein [Promethearchaeota archaeon]
MQTNNKKTQSVKASQKGEIKEASIAKFMRKRTQLVGFDFGLFKHTQYAVEFVDNALDAIEKFQWDAKNELEEIRNLMAKLSVKTEALKQDYFTILEQINNKEAPSKKGVAKKANLIALKLEPLLEEFEQINFRISYKLGIPYEKNKRLSSLLDNVKQEKIRQSNIDEDFHRFKKLMDYFLKQYNLLLEEVENLEHDFRFMYNLDKSRYAELETLSYNTPKSESKPTEDLKKIIQNGENGVVTDYGELEPSSSKMGTTTEEAGEPNSNNSANNEEGSLVSIDSDSNNKDQSNQVVADEQSAPKLEESSNNTTGINGQEASMENISKNNESSLDIPDDTESISKLIEEEDLVEDEQAQELRKLKKKEKELQEELQKIINALDDFTYPVLNIIDSEPLVILRMKEKEAPQIYKEKGDTDVFLYEFEVFDNGTGMRPEDLLKYGKYLASSKSQRLKQTRGSQGFGAPSAFSDAQNTTGRPITVISKHFSQVMGMCSEFYTTEKNTKVYVIEPTKIECKFAHGTYVRLEYLNKKYKRGYVDQYVEKTALMNSHITLIFIDPYGEEHIYPRRVDYFPKEPKYALPHPSSIKIGDFQDLLRSSENLSVAAFLTDNFVRMSSSLAKKIILEAEFEIERRLKYLALSSGYLSVIKKISEPLLFVREEKRVYGRSKKARPINILYLISDSGLKGQIFELLKKYNNAVKERDKIEKKQNRINNEIQKETERKIIRTKEKELKVLEKESNNAIKIMKDVKKELGKILASAELKNELNDDVKLKEKIFEITKELQISKTKPAELTQTQIEYLYMAFKNQKYMAPPTDTAIPVGETALETALIKHFDLQVSNRADYFGGSEDEVKPISEFERLKRINQVLSVFNDTQLVSEDFKFNNIIEYDKDLEKKVFESLLLEFDLQHTTGDDFVAAHTRKPTSGKGLAFVVEAVMAYSPKKIESARQASQVITRYVNRTPKLRDNSDCALWMGIQGVNWKNYKVKETFDNGIPKGNYIIFINCSGPYTHLMFKSQSKNALAEDEILLSEVKLCMEVIGRKLRNYMNKKEIRETRRRRSSVIESKIPIFVQSIYNIAKTDPRYKDLKQEILIEKINEALELDTDPETALSRKNVLNVATISSDIETSSELSENYELTIENIMKILKEKPYTLKELLLKMKLDKLDGRILILKLRKMEKDGIIRSEIDSNGKKFYVLNQ